MFLFYFAYLFYSVWKEGEGENHWIGVLLIIVSLLLDGLLGHYEDKAKIKYSISGFCLMRNMTLCSFLFGLLGNTFQIIILIVLFLVTIPSGEFFAAVKFCTTNPSAYVYVLLFSACGSIGQMFIFLTVAKFGSLVFAIVKTTRKFMSIIISILMYNYPFTSLQYIGMTVIFFCSISHFSLKEFPSQKNTPKDAPNIKNKTEKLV